MRLECTLSSKFNSCGTCSLINLQRGNVWTPMTRRREMFVHACLRWSTGGIHSKGSFTISKIKSIRKLSTITCNLGSCASDVIKSSRLRQATLRRMIDATITTVISLRNLRAFFRRCNNSLLRLPRVKNKFKTHFRSFQMKNRQG